MPYATINGARLWYDELGYPAADAQPLLLHHGYTASRVNWMPVAVRLAQRYRVLLMECRGAGASEHTADGYSLEQYAADVIGLMDHLQLERCSYAGHSMGGGIGYVLALEHAHRLTRLILMASVPADGFPAPDLAARTARLALRRERNRSALLAQYTAGSARPDIETRAWFESRIEHIFAVSDGHFDQSADAMQTLRVGHRLAEILLPTLVIAGSADSLLAANLQDFARLPNAALHVLARAGHDVALHEPDAVATAIDDFMRFGIARPIGN